MNSRHIGNIQVEAGNNQKLCN